MVTINDSYASVDTAVIGAFEAQMGLSFPQEYLTFLAKYNGGEPYPNGFRAKGWDRGMLVADQFFGISTGDSDDLSEVNRIYKDRIPLGFLVVGDDPGGNLICLGTTGIYRGQVYFWDHENEPQPEEPNSLIYPNMYWVADDFTEFLDCLTEP